MKQLASLMNMLIKMNRSLLNRRITLLIASLLLFSGCAESVHQDAEKYRNGKCVAFYPPQSEAARDYAMALCADGEERIFDYDFKKSGDICRISYLDGNILYLNEDLSDLKLSVNDGAEMLSDMLRYEMKKQGIDEAYTSSFWLKSTAEELDLSHIEAKLKNDMLFLHFSDFDYTMKLPLGYLKKLSGVDPGVKPTGDYEKRYYIDPDRPMIALTYDDGPYREVDQILFEIFNRYGARATFYSVGSRMSRDELYSIQEGIDMGMEFGSHTEEHISLSGQNVDEARLAIMEPVEYVRDKLHYEMKTYRPPYGNRNYEVEDVIGMPAVLWNVDSKDWSNRDADITYRRVMDGVRDGDIVLMHSLYRSTARATERLVPDLIDEGYQLVTVTELLKYKGYDTGRIHAIGNN